MASLAVVVEKGGTDTDTHSEIQMAEGVVGVMEDTKPTEYEAMGEGNYGDTLSMAEDISNEKRMATEPPEDITKQEKC